MTPMEGRVKSNCFVLSLSRLVLEVQAGGTVARQQVKFIRPKPIESTSDDQRGTAMSTNWIVCRASLDDIDSSVQLVVE